MVLIHDVLREYKDAQFIISTHSPLLLVIPGPRFYRSTEAPIREIEYEQTAPYVIVQEFLNRREQFLEELFAETPSLFDTNKCRARARGGRTAEAAVPT